MYLTIDINKKQMPRLISLFDVQPILTALQSDQLILTPNQRLSSRIASAYAIHCSEVCNQLVVDAPNVYSLNNWLDACWQKLLLSADPLALELTPISSAQEQLLWESIVEGSALGAALLRPSATAQQAASAYRTLIDWQQDINADSLRNLLAGDEDSKILLEWIDDFESRCRENNWLPSVKRVERIIEAFEQNKLEPINDFYAIAFDDITPLNQKLFDVMGRCAHLQADKQCASVTVSPCDSPEQELLASAVWAKQILRNDEQANVAIVIPDLTQRRQQVERILQEVFETDFNQLDFTSDDNSSIRKNLPFNFSAGYALLDAPVITAAIDVLSLHLPQLDIELLQRLLQSPFYNLIAEDVEQISQLIFLLREEKDFSLTPFRFRQLVEKVGLANSDKEADSDLCQDWHLSQEIQQLAILARSEKISQPRSPEQWVEFFQTQLNVIGWPGLRELDSVEYQQVSQWQSILQEFISLGFVLNASDKKFNYGEAITQLRSILSRHIFQPQTADSSLQVLGTLEAAGLQFSHLWLHSMSEKQWPASPAPNPLLPYSLQRDTDMPHASAERELAYAQSLSQRFLENSHQLIISYPKRLDDLPVSVSSLFSAYPEKTITELLGKPLDNLVPLQELKRRHHESAKLQSFTSGNAPLVTEAEKVRGGSSLFANQSACPFRAFSRHRLGLKKLSEPEVGLNAADRGSLLHRALELIWERLKNQQALLALDESELGDLSEEVARYAVTELSQRRGSLLGSRYQQLEVERLKKLLLAWMGIEKERVDFVVEALEQRQEFRFQQLSLAARIDRIDRLSDGSLVIVDYKTGMSTISRWWGERPDEPQLPLYCGLLELDQSMLSDPSEDDRYSSPEDGATVGAIAFAQVRVDGCSLKGIGAQELPEPKLQWQEKIQTEAGAYDWPQLKKQWLKVLTALANDFIAGKSMVDPKQPNKTCQYCDLSALCRINHQEVTA
jgi:probable DNA repair protein